MKKIVAIGGGENGRIKSDGTQYPYETGPIDKEIIRLTGKEHPHFLLLAHSLPLEWQQGYFDTMKAIYGDMYGCKCKDLKSNLLEDSEIVRELIDWADIIYEGGGDTVTMIDLWHKTEFDIVLRQAWEDGKVMCGVSAGANCWFTAYSTDSLKIQKYDDAPMTSGQGLNFVKGYFVPHADEAERIPSAKVALKENGMTGYYLSNCRALAIVDNTYRLITSDESYHNKTAFGRVAVWRDGKYTEKEIKQSDGYHSITEILMI